MNYNFYYSLFANKTDLHICLSIFVYEMYILWLCTFGGYIIFDVEITDSYLSISEPVGH